jgi:hypothetical protein
MVHAYMVKVPVQVGRLHLTSCLRGCNRSANFDDFPFFRTPVYSVAQSAVLGGALPRLAALQLLAMLYGNGSYLQRISHDKLATDGPHSVVRQEPVGLRMKPDH